ncbi:MBL fold metallo-hydrolase [Streptococcus suis]|nr:MBL fold metallo-hydrolase [Streptococcus suis]
MREVYPGIYTFPICLPNSPLREIHSYIIKGEERSLVIDTGYNHPESLADMEAGLAVLGISIQSVDLVITHLHADHSGLATYFYDRGARIFAGKVDGDLFNAMASGEYWNMLESFKTLYGIWDQEMAIEDNPGYRFCLDRPVPFQVLEIGSHFQFGNFDFEILDLIGHTPGHIGLYDRDKQILFSADTVLDPITPNITFWGWEYPNILRTYMETLGRLRKMPNITLFPGHRKVIDDHVSRIDQLIDHHFERMQEILDAIGADEKVTVRDVSSRIKWRIKADSWDQFPKPQKWFASGETMAHLDYLVESGHLSMTLDKGVLYFKKLQTCISKG